MLAKKNIITLFSLLVATLFFCVVPILAQDSSTSAPTSDEKAQLQAQLQEIENQIAQYQQELNTIKGQKNTLQNKIKQLQKQQAAINLQIRATNLQITQLGKQLNQTEQAIDDGNDKIGRLQEQMAQYIRAINQYDDLPILYAVVTKDSLSDVFDEMERYSQVSTGLTELFEQTIQTKKELDQQAQELVDAQEEAKNLVSIKTLQQQQLSGTMNEQNGLLQETKGRESSYQSIISDAQKKAAEVRSRLYQLLGVSTQITFGEAVQIAQWASSQTGVRAAFLLAVLTQESNLGKNVGTCNRPGDPPEKSWRVVMKSTRDQEPFLQITQELGLDPNITPVSCPMRDSKGRQIGWGGAMGPAQFIPSTWMGYRDRISAVTGKAANPWDIRDAFIAAAIKLAADGAGTKAGEWAAAMRYFSGSTNTRYRFYGDNVVAIANQYQSDIDSLGVQ